MATLVFAGFRRERGKHFLWGLKSGGNVGLGRTGAFSKTGASQVWRF